MAGIYGNSVLNENNIFKSIIDDMKRLTGARKCVLKKNYSEAFKYIKYVNHYNEQDLLFLYNFLYSYGEKLEIDSNKSEIQDYIDFWYKNSYRFNSDKIRYKNLNEKVQKLRIKLEKDNINTLSNSDKTDIEKLLKKIINKFNNNSKIKEILKKFNAKLTCERFEENNNSISFTVCENDQETRINISDIIEDIAKELEKEYNKNINVDIGDGDEGCIYISI